MKAKLENLISILETCGSDPRNWPAESRDAMESFVANSPEARAAVAEAAELDRWLDQLPEPNPDPALAARIIAELPERPAPQLRKGPATLRPRPLWILPLAAAALLALWIAPATPPDSGQMTNFAAAPGLNLDDSSFVWDMPSDVLLNVVSLDPINNVPAFECLYDDQDCLGSMENRESFLEIESGKLT
ncbi:MAG: hypothetical protein P8K76_11660 [Candidatus Binatia bacterium]|nr:hypothetical protein [Candidatus Binatia bacterium]MDG1399675.1 hypothetical protein [Candidatus Binatia bacterium]MDG1959507.1 hypothetical protein [Candidatus Binatia bacterium]MDG2010431.1 hypothetical protein [Candidatus Binatia bacterium]